MVHLFLAYRKANIALRDEIMSAVQALSTIDAGEAYPITIWSDNHLLSGDDWERMIAIHIDHSDIFLLLVTTATSGGYALEVELQRAIERARSGRCKIVPIVCDDVFGFLKSYGLEDYRLNRIPRGGIGVSQPPYNLNKQLWLDDVISGVKDAVRRNLETMQMRSLEMKTAFGRVDLAVVMVLDVAEAEKDQLQSYRPAIEYAARRAQDVLRTDTPRILDLIVTPRRLVQEARRTATDVDATETRRALMELTAALDDLSEACRQAGLGARPNQDDPRPPVDRADPGTAEDLRGIEQSLDRVDRAAEGLAEDAQSAPPAKKALLEEAAERLGAESRLTRAAAGAPEIDIAEMQATTDQMEDTVRSVAVALDGDVSTWTRALVSAAQRAVHGVVRFVGRIVARAFKRPLPDRPFMEPTDEFIGSDSTATRKFRTAPFSPESDNWFEPGAKWSQPMRGLDALGWPRMVTIPRGKFLMGASKSEAGSRDTERPTHSVSIETLVAMGEYPVTFDQWDAAMRGGAELAVQGDGNWGRGRRPLINVSWQDAKAYIAWLNASLGLDGRRDAYRLPSEAEWEYACRAGTTTPFSFGETISTEQANYDGNYAYGRGKKSGVCLERTSPVGQYSANAFGLYDMHGNVWEWCEDVWHDSYEGAPADGSAWVTGYASRRVLRGGSWYDSPQDCRSGYRIRDDATIRNNSIGFRLARTLSPPPS